MWLVLISFILSGWCGWSRFGRCISGPDNPAGPIHHPMKEGGVIVNLPGHTDAFLVLFGLIYALQDFWIHTENPTWSTWLKLLKLSCWRVQSSVCLTWCPTGDPCSCCSKGKCFFDLFLLQCTKCFVQKQEILSFILHVFKFC